MSQFNKEKNLKSLEGDVEQKGKILTLHIIKLHPFSVSCLTQNRFDCLYFTCLYFLIYVLILVFLIWQKWMQKVCSQHSTHSPRKKKCGEYTQTARNLCITNDLIYTVSRQNHVSLCVSERNWFCQWSTDLDGMGSSQSKDKMHCTRYLNGKGPPALTEIREFLSSFCWSLQ